MNRPRAFPVLWRAAAGPRLGFGHLVRSVSLARALGVPPVISVRAGGAGRRAADNLGATLAGRSLPRAVREVRPSVVVVDDPNAAAARAALTAARRARLPVVSVHDLGLAWIDSDLLIDGAIVQRRQGAAPGRALLGTRYAVLNLDAGAGVGRSRSDFGRPGDPTVLIALGGGPRWRLASAIARRLTRSHPRVRVRIAGGFVPLRRVSDARICWLGPLPTLGRELAAATVAVVGGGVSAYEACACGAPAVALSIVRAQRPTVAAFSAAGAVIDGGEVSRAIDRVATGTAAKVLGLLDDPAVCRQLSRTAQALVDMRGAARVAREIRALINHRETRNGKR